MSDPHVSAEKYGAGNMVGQAAGALGMGGGQGGHGGRRCAPSWGNLDWNFY